jgi:hypothetical protein
LNAALTGSLAAVPSQQGMPRVHGILLQTHLVQGLLHNTDQIRVVIPASIRADANGSGMGSAMASSIVALHFELRAPGKLVYTNGYITPGGFVRWDIPLTRPTIVRYDTQVPNYGGYLIIVLLAILGVVVSIMIALFVRARLREHTV